MGLGEAGKKLSSKVFSRFTKTLRLLPPEQSLFDPLQTAHGKCLFGYDRTFRAVFLTAVTADAGVEIKHRISVFHLQRVGRTHLFTDSAADTFFRVEQRA